MKLRWTRQALADLREIRAYIELQRPLTAERVARRIRARARTVVEQPFMGHRVEDVEDPNVREVFQDRYRIVYRVRDGRIEVLRVIDGARLIASDEIGEQPAEYRPL